ncbi:MAG: F0F1 ATP synthase subunit epsilon [Gammaproteobacteria bacterium]|nr:F0F1 ATP synthase subunit epsilon [Gammaproteobacteria bacterium]
MLHARPDAGRLRGLTLHLQQSTQCDRVEDVTSFVGEDASGSFGLRPGHEAFATILSFGLARFRVARGGWEYVAVPGGVLYGRGGELRLCARRLFRHTDYEEVARELREQLIAEERDLHDFKQALRHLEQEMLKRLWQIGRDWGGR